MIAVSATEDGWAYEQFFRALGDYSPRVLMADAAQCITNGKPENF
jgi:hypothetical protein